MSIFSSQHHSFDIKLASIYGVEEAILIHHLQHWIRLNCHRGKNFREGRTWTYQSRKDICGHFPYWNEDRAKYLCEKLEKMGVLITANYNKSAVDKTLWYAFSDEKMFGVDPESSNNFYDRQKCPSMGKSAHPGGKSAHPEGKSAQPIPDTKKEDTKEKIEETHPTLSKPELAKAACVSVPPSFSFESHGEFVKLRRDQYSELSRTHGEELVKDMIAQINDYIAAHGKKGYKDYSAAIRQWIRRREDQKKPVSFPQKKNDLSRHFGLSKDTSPRDPSRTFDCSGDD